MEKLNIFTEDWKKIPQNLRFLILTGIILIFNSWFLDHWFSNGKEPYKFWWIFDIRVFGYSLGLTLILLCLLLLIVKQFWLLGAVILFRRRYPISELDNTYHLGWFKGKLMLFDNKKKLYYHVRPWETAQDLSFVGRGWEFQDGFNEKTEYCVTPTLFLNTSKYKNGGSINTHGE